MAAPGKGNQILYTITSWNANALSQPPAESDIKALVKSIDNWDDVIQLLEEHGLTPVFLEIISAYKDLFPASFYRMLRTLEIRQKGVCNAQHKALSEIHNLFSQNDIPLVLLKGSALRYCVYSEPHQRMMFDLDLLIPEDKSDLAVRLLQKLNFRIDPDFIGSHHHLPAAQKHVDGYHVVIELHTEAISKDMNTVISFANHQHDFLSLDIDDNSYLMLSHIDNMQHLCKHTFARDAVIKLSGIVDIIRYADTYFDEIDWEYIKCHHSYIINTISLLDCIVERNPKLASLCPELSAQEKQNMSGIGLGMIPLRDALKADISFVQKCKNIFIPSEWWTRAYYNIPANKSLLMTRLWTHPKTALQWIVSKEFQQIKIPARVKLKAALLAIKFS